MKRLVSWLLIFGVGILLGRLPVHPLSASSSAELQDLWEVAIRQQTFIEAARENCERRPEDFIAASRLALLLSGLRENQQRQEREFGVRVQDPVHEPELRTLLVRCRKMARSQSDRELVRGLEARTQQQNLLADSSSLH